VRHHGKHVVNWRAIAKYTATVWLSLFLVSFLGGLISPPANDARSALVGYILSSLASLLVGTAVFGALSARQVARPFLHAVLVLVAYVTISLLLNRIVEIWLPTTYPAVLTAMDWLVLLTSFLLGNLVGLAVRRWESQRHLSVRGPADA